LKKSTKKNLFLVYMDKYNDTGIRLSLKERQKILALAQGLGAECAKHKIDKETATEMIVIAMQETTKQLINARPK
jgi:hypothetical protein